MFTSATKLASLALVALWASGADLYLHQRVDHHPAQLAFTVEHGRMPHCAVTKSIDEHDCLTCTMLALMIAAGEPPLQFLPTPQPTAIAQAMVCERAPHRTELPTPPARGPPALG